MAKDVHYTDPSRQADLPEYDEAAAADYVSNLQPIKDQKKKSKRNKIIFVVVLSLIIVGAAAYFFLLKPEPKQQTVQTSQPVQNQEQTEVVGTEKYSSTSLRLSFDYPKNWKLDDATQGLVKVESPVTKLSDINGESSDAKVVVTFLSAGSEVPAFEEASATAMIDSEKITYDSPSQNQRKQTYLSFAGFGAAGLDAVFITGDAGYQKEQIIPESDIKKIEPIISVTFYKCVDAVCGGEAAGAYTIAVDEWKSDSMLQAAQAMLESLRVE